MDMVTSYVKNYNVLHFLSYFESVAMERNFIDSN
jgi:hypothetical protein